MESTSLVFLPLILGVIGGALALGVGVYLSRGRMARADVEADRLTDEASHDAESRKREIMVAAQEKALAIQDEADLRDREADQRESSLDTRARKLDRDASELGNQGKKLERREQEIEALARKARTSEQSARELEQQATGNLERIAGLTAEQARAELVAGIEQSALEEATKIARRIEDESRQNAERDARNLIVQASQRVNLRDAMESTVSFIELPNDEMKGRIIGKEGRNIRALEMATGIDLIVDDTPRSVWITSFDPVRREIARVAIDRLLEDGRIHPARIEEAVKQVTDEIEALIEEKGNDAAFALGLDNLHPQLARLVGKMRYHTCHGQNLLQHAMETAQIAGFMCQEVGARVDIAQRAGLLHEIGQVVEDSSSHPIFTSAELSGKYRESEEVVQAIRSLHADVQATCVEALLLNTANRLSETRPGARKENLAVFIERLKRMESIATGFPGVERAYAVKAGKELRIIVDTAATKDDSAYKLSRDIARALERELSYPGQIKVSVVRETRAVRFAV